jgi:hypothetical protein
MDKLASFRRFSITASSLASGSLAIMLSLHAPRRQTSGVRSCANPPAGYCQTPTAELGKTERDPISTIGPSIQYVTESCDPVGKIKLLWALASLVRQDGWEAAICGGRNRPRLLMVAHQLASASELFSPLAVARPLTILTR